MSQRVGAPVWLAAVVLLGGIGAILLLANYGYLPVYWRSWPLIVALVGLTVLLFEPLRYLAFGGFAMTTGVLLYLHTTERVTIAKAWPWLLVALAVLVVADRAIERLARS